LDIIYFRFQIRTSVVVNESVLRQLFEIHFLPVVFISCSLFSSYPTYLGAVLSFCIFLFLFLFESSVSFIFRIDSLATRDLSLHFCFACFLFFYCSWVIYTFLECAAKLVLFGIGLSSAWIARRWDERCEHVRILRVFERNMRDVRICFLPLTNFCRCYHVSAKQHTHPSRYRT